MVNNVYMMIYRVCLLCIVNYCYGEVAFVIFSNNLVYIWQSLDVSSINKSVYILNTKYRVQTSNSHRGMCIGLKGTTHTLTSWHLIKQLLIWRGFIYIYYIIFYFFKFCLAFDFCRFCVVNRFFSSPPQRPPPTLKDSIPECIHYLYFSILILETEPVFSLLNVQC